MESPEFYQTGYYNAQFPLEKRLSDGKNGEHFIIDDLLDFPVEEPLMSAADGGFEETVTGASVITAADTSVGGSTAKPHFQHVGGPHSLADGFSSELCVPYDELAELEWLSTFVDESFSCEELDLQKLQLIQGKNALSTQSSKAPQNQFKPENPQTGPTFRPENAQTGPTFRPEMSVPAKARSKRSRTAPGNWASRLLAVSSVSGSATSSSSESGVMAGKKLPMPKKKEGPEEEGRRCLHCATDKTPQWRSGPMGPKTLCNACGVRYKSGRLVPEYRPASSPTFVLTKHSNSHRKVLELRRQKEMVRAQQHQQFLHQNMMFDVPNGDDYLIHQHIGPDFRQMI